MSDKEKLNNLTQEIWKSAESLRSKFKSYENQNIVLPMITIRRIECVLESWRGQELTSLKKSLPDANEAQLKKILTAQEKDFSFYNTSEWSLKKLMEEDSQLLAANFKDYLNAFSANIQAIINHFEFKKTIDSLKSRGLLGIIIKQYAEQDLGLSVLTNLDMGYVYEELLRRFSEQSGGEAGEHFTPREVIRLMVELLQIQFTQEHQQILIYDPACGTGGMLSVAKKHILDTIPDNQHHDKPETKQPPAKARWV
jgi:type I restriction enzyme M protein